MDKIKYEQIVDEIAAILCDCEHCSCHKSCAGYETFLMRKENFARPLADSGYRSLQDTEQEHLELYEEAIKQFEIRLRDRLYIMHYHGTAIKAGIILDINIDDIVNELLSNVRTLKNE